MCKLVLIGGGGHCVSVLDSILAANKFSDIVITDEKIVPGTKVLGVPVVGADSELESLYRKGFDYAFITVGHIKNIELRKKLVQKSFKIGFKFPVICDCSAVISHYTEIGVGTFIGKNAIVNANSSIGEHCIVNTGAIVEHECFVGDFCHLSVGTILCGNCSVGDDCFIGAGSTIIQGISIGKNAVVGANSTVICNIEDNRKVKGLVC